MLSANFKPKRTAAASRGFIATAGLSCYILINKISNEYFWICKTPAWTSCEKLKRTDFVVGVFLRRDTGSAKRSIAIASRPSVRPSVCPSVTLRYHVHMCWTSAKVIAAYGLRSWKPQHGQSSPAGSPPKFGWNRDGVAVLNRMTCNISEIGQRRTKVTIDDQSNKKLHTRFRLVPKSTTLDDLKAILHYVSKHVRRWKSTTKIWIMTIRHYQRQRCTLVSDRCFKSVVIQMFASVAVLYWGLPTTITWS